jgi:hypothetical protein
MTIDELEQDALAIRQEMAATNKIKDHAVRMAALSAIRRLTVVNGVTVGTLIPENRTIYRRHHHRFVSRHNGKVITRAQAAHLIEEASC